MKGFGFLLIVVVAVGVLTFACGGQSAAVPAAPTANSPAPTASGPTSASGQPTAAAPSQGEALLNERCTVCHNLDRVKTASKTPAEWAATVDTMIGHGAVLSPTEKDTLVKYLADTFKKQ